MQQGMQTHTTSSWAWRFRLRRAGVTTHEQALSTASSRGYALLDRMLGRVQYEKRAEGRAIKPSGERWHRPWPGPYLSGRSPMARREGDACPHGGWLSNDALQY